MRLNLFSKNEDLDKSAPVLGAKILNIFEKRKAGESVFSKLYKL